MKKLAFVLICFAFIQTSEAQIDFKYGLCAGISSSKVSLSEFKTDTFTINESNAKIGFHFGALLRLEVLMLYVQPELLFSSTGGEVKVKDVVKNKELIKQQSFKKIDIPIMIGYKLGPIRA